jgi:small subunit ribosomal protein S17
MTKIFEGKIVSLKMQNTAVVEVLRRVPHPLYKKVLKRTKRHQADTAGLSLLIGDKVKIVEVRPISKEKHFKVLEKIK